MNERAELARLVDELARLVAQARPRPGRGTRMRTGVVTAAPGGGVATVWISGTEIPGIPYATSYTPNIFHEVIVSITDGAPMILGKSSKSAV